MAVVAQRPPWYRRLFGRQRAVAAGQRPDHLGRAAKPRRSILGTLIVLLMLGAVVGAVLGYVLIPDIRERVSATVADLRLTFLPETERVLPASASGDGVEDNDGELAVDDNLLTFWLADPADGRPTLLVQFPRAINLAGTVFHSGSATDSDFGTYRRPRTVELSFPGTSIPAIRLDLPSESAPLSRPVDARGIRSVEVRILDFHEALQGGADAIALREIEFVERR